MNTQTKAQQLKEIEFQTKMLNNLKRWIRNLVILSSVGVALAYWGLGIQSGMPYTVFGVVGVVVSVVCVILCVIIGLGFKRGKDNVDKIVRAVQYQNNYYHINSFYKCDEINNNPLETHSRSDSHVAVLSFWQVLQPTTR